jgi:sugar/nucleoside kinase (ribokinase family)
VAVKRGARGSVVWAGEAAGGLLEQPAVPLAGELVREAVGAGDAYDAGFLDTLVRGGSVADAARFGTAAAAITLSGRGGAEAIVGREAVEAMLARLPAARAWPGD